MKMTEADVVWTPRTDLVRVERHGSDWGLLDAGRIVGRLRRAQHQGRSSEAIAGHVRAVQHHCCARSDFGYRGAPSALGNR